MRRHDFKFQNERKTHGKTTIVYMRRLLGNDAENKWQVSSDAENKWQVSSLSIPFTCILIISKGKISNTIRLERGGFRTLTHTIQAEERDGNIFAMFVYAEQKK